MNLIKAQFLNKHNGQAYGRHYTYDAGVNNVEVGDLVQLNEKGRGIVTEVDVDKSEAEAFMDRLKTIIGKVEESEGEKIE